MTIAGSVVATTTKPYASGGVECTSVVWTSNASGAVTGDVVNMSAGTIVLVEFVPGTGGSQPSSSYSVDFLNPNGVSVFDRGDGTSIGASLSNTDAADFDPVVAPPSGDAAAVYSKRWIYAGAYQLTVSGGGNAKSGTVNIYKVGTVI